MGYSRDSDPRQWRFGLEMYRQKEKKGKISQKRNRSSSSLLGAKMISALGATCKTARYLNPDLWRGIDEEAGEKV